MSVRCRVKGRAMRRFPEVLAGWYASGTGQFSACSNVVCQSNAPDKAFLRFTHWRSSFGQYTVIRSDDYARCSWSMIELFRRGLGVGPMADTVDGAMPSCACSRSERSQSRPRCIGRSNSLAEFYRDEPDRAGTHGLVQSHF